MKEMAVLGKISSIHSLRIGCTRNVEIYEISEGNTIRSTFREHWLVGNMMMMMMMMGPLVSEGGLNP